LLCALIDPPVLDSLESMFRSDLSLPLDGRPSHPIYRRLVWPSRPVTYALQVLQRFRFIYELQQVPHLGHKRSAHLTGASEEELLASIRMIEAAGGKVLMKLRGRSPNGNAQEHATRKDHRRLRGGTRSLLVVQARLRVRSG